MPSVSYEKARLSRHASRKGGQILPPTRERSAPGIVAFSHQFLAIETLCWTGNSFSFHLLVQKVTPTTRLFSSPFRVPFLLSLSVSDRVCPSPYSYRRATLDVWSTMHRRPLQASALCRTPYPGHVNVSMTTRLHLPSRLIHQVMPTLRPPSSPAMSPRC